MKPEDIAREVGKQARREPLDLIRVKIDKLAGKKLDPLALAGELGPVKELLAGLDESDFEMALVHIKKALILPAPAIKAIRKEIAKTKVKGKTLVDDLEPDNRLHPAVDFQNGAMTLGFRVYNGESDALALIVSDGQSLRAMLNPKQVEINGREFRVDGNGVPPRLDDVWSLVDLKKFLKSPERPGNLYVKIKDTLKSFLDVSEEAYGFLAVWAVGTFWVHLFSAYPFLHLFGPKETGKSKTLEALRHLCLNAVKTRDITAAALGDTLDAQRGVVLLDQAETLGKSRDGAVSLIGLLADSYKKQGGRRRIVEITKSGRRVLEFSTYGAKAFASTRSIDPDLADRCARVQMVRTRRRLPDLEGSESIWAELRDAIYRFALLRFKEAQTYYQEIVGDGTRSMELWRPLLATARALEVPQGEIDRLYDFYRGATRETRHEPSPWESCLLEVLRNEGEKHHAVFELTVNEIINMMEIEGDKQPYPKWIGDTLARFALYTHKHRITRGKTKETAYRFESSIVMDRSNLYLRDDTKEGENKWEISSKDLSDVSDPIFQSNIDELQRTQEKLRTCPNVSSKSISQESGGHGHDRTCPPKKTCPPQQIEMFKEKDSGHVGQANPGDIGITKPTSSTIWEAEVD